MIFLLKFLLNIFFLERHNKAQLTQNDKLKKLIKAVGMKDYKVVDITKKTGKINVRKNMSCQFETSLAIFLSAVIAGGIRIYEKDRLFLLPLFR